MAPTGLEIRLISDAIRTRDRMGQWEVLSLGRMMCSTLPRGTARVNPLVMAIEANFVEEVDKYELEP